MLKAITIPVQRELNYDNSIYSFLEEVNSVYIDYLPNAIIFKNDVPVVSVYLIESGYIKLVDSSTAGHKIVYLVPGGNFLGISELFGNRKYSLTAYAADFSVVRMIDSSSFLNYFENNCRFACQMVSLVKQQEINSLLNSIRLLKLPVEKRLSNLILWLADRVYKSDQFQLTLDRTEIAGYFATSIKTVNRIFSNFKELQLIELKGKHLIIANKTDLVSVSKGMLHPI
jgi:CRP-like cAMP-binding protein